MFICRLGLWLLHSSSMFAVKAKNYGVTYNQCSSIAFDETYSYWSAPKAPYFSVFRWSPQGGLVSIGRHFVTRVYYIYRKGPQQAYYRIVPQRT